MILTKIAVLIQATTESFEVCVLCKSGGLSGLYRNTIVSLSAA